MKRRAAMPSGDVRGTQRRSEKDLLIEEQLRENEARFRQIFDESPMGMATVGRDFRFLKVNAAFCGMLGYTAEELAGRTYAEVTHPAQVPADIENVQKLLRGELQKYHTEKRYITKQGETVWGSVTISVVRDRHGAFRYFLAAIENINERKRAEMALHETQRQLLTLLSNLPGMAYRCRNDRDWTMEFISQGSMELLGYRPESLIGNRELAYASLIHPDDRDGVWQEIQTSVHSRRPFQLMYRVMTQGGKEKWVWEQGRAVVFSGGRPQVLEGFITDITTRKRAEEILTRDKETLEKLVQETAQELVKANLAVEQSKRLSDIGMLAASTAHEMRNPLAAIKTAVYNIKRKIGDPRIAGHLANIDKKVSESDQIIQNLLSFSRLREPQCESVPVAVLLDECLDLIMPKFLRWDVRIEKKYSFRKPGCLRADRTHMRILFSNLLDNAMQALPDKTGMVSLEGSSGRGTLKIAVRDTGTGIDPDDVQKVFEPFFTRKSRGTGLGLTICRKIVELHKGTITVASVKGAGTTVTVVLPLWQG
jgi:PAS domain S-box-containing protein